MPARRWAMAAPAWAYDGPVAPIPACEALYYRRLTAFEAAAGPLQRALQTARRRAVASAWAVWVFRTDRLHDVDIEAVRARKLLARCFAAWAQRHRGIRALSWAVATVAARALVRPRFAHWLRCTRKWLLDRRMQAARGWWRRRVLRRVFVEWRRAARRLKFALRGLHWWLYEVRWHSLRIVALAVSGWVCVRVCE